MILVVSHRGDQHALVVLDRLIRADVPTLLFDTYRFPTDMALSIAQNRDGQQAFLTVDDERIDLNQIARVWWRRPRGFQSDPEITQPVDINFVHSECTATVDGLWRSLDAEWINDPVMDELACRKVWQLKVATKLGLRTPQTLVTNDPAAARNFVDAQRPNGTIYKAFTATEEEWRETRLLKPEEEQGLEQVSYAPVIFQEHIKADIDLRITVIGDDMFPAAIYSGTTDYKVDFRMTIHQAKVEAHVLPDHITQKLKALMETLGLVYGAIDMRLTPDGEYVFLEVNPSGQWLFMEDRTGQPITDAFVSRLSQGV